jgi:hypothetical protein
MIKMKSKFKNNLGRVRVNEQDSSLFAGTFKG